MLRFSLIASVLAVALLGALAVGRLTAPTGAQEGTPPVGEEGLEGLTFEPLGFGVAEELPAAPAGLSLFRATLAPGTSIPIEADDPSVALVYVESGALTARVEAPMRVLRAAAVAAFATPGAAPEPEEVPAGTEFTLEAGDPAVFPPNVGGEIRNDGGVPTVLLATLIEPEQAEATPAP